MPRFRFTCFSISTILENLLMVSGRRASQLCPIVIFARPHPVGATVGVRTRSHTFAGHDTRTGYESCKGNPSGGPVREEHTRMAQLSMNETTTFRWLFEEDVANYAAAGIPAIGVWREKLSDFGVTKGAELLQESGLAVSHLLWAGGFTGSDGRSFKASVDDAIEAVQTANAIGAPALVVYSGARAGHTHNHARRLLREALKEMAPLSSELGVTLALEPMHPDCATEFTFLTSIDDVLDAINAVGSPQVKMVFDTYHLGRDEACVERIGQISQHIALVQLGDSREPAETEQNRCLLGEGIVPLKEIVNALAAAGYDGFYDVELLGEEIETIEYSQLLEHAKKSFDDLLSD